MEDGTKIEGESMLQKCIEIKENGLETKEIYSKWDGNGMEREWKWNGKISTKEIDAKWNGNGIKKITTPTWK